MKRRLFSILAALSLLLFVASIALWLRSYYVRDIVTFGRTQGNRHVAQSILGRLHIVSTLDGGYDGGASWYSDRLSPNAIWNGDMSSYPVSVQWRFGLVCQQYTRSQFSWSSTSQTLLVIRHRLIVLPYWAISLIFVITPTCWLVAYLRRRRIKPGHCRNCGYDLRASPERCPECGTPIPAQSFPNPPQHI